MKKGTKASAIALAGLMLALGACQKQAKTAAPVVPPPAAKPVLAISPTPSLPAVISSTPSTDPAYTTLHDFMQARMHRQVDAAQSLMERAARQQYADHENGLELTSQTSNPYYAHWFVRQRAHLGDAIAFVVNITSEYTGSTKTDPGFDETIVVGLSGATKKIVSASRPSDKNITYTVDADVKTCLNVRSGPGAKSASLACVPSGTKLYGTDEVQAHGGATWVHVHSADSDRWGWVDGFYLLGGSKTGHD